MQPFLSSAFLALALAPAAGLAQCPARAVLAEAQDGGHVEVFGADGAELLSLSCTRSVSWDGTQWLCGTGEDQFQMVVPFGGPPCAAPFGTSCWLQLGDEAKYQASCQAADEGAACMLSPMAAQGPGRTPISETPLKAVPRLDVPKMPTVSAH